MLVLAADSMPTYFIQTPAASYLLPQRLSDSLPVYIVGQVIDMYTNAQ